MPLRLFPLNMAGMTDVLPASLSLSCNLEKNKQNKKKKIMSKTSFNEELIERLDFDTTGNVDFTP